MRIPHTVVPKLRAATVLAFVATCAVVFSFLWLNAGGKLPLISKEGYRVSVPMSDIDNLVFQSDVRMAGVEVGKIEQIEPEGRDVMVELELDDDVAPLHEGVQITVRNKTMIEETYLEIVDGDGSQIDSGAQLPRNAGVASVQINDVLTSLDDKAREDLSAALVSSGAATSDSREDVDAMMTGLGALGGSGAQTLDALADQSEDLKVITAHATTMLDALDVQGGRIADLASDSNVLTSTMVDRKTKIESLMRTLPPLLDTTRTASGSLKQLADPLDAVATNLDEGAPDLNAALIELPATSKDLRALMPALDTTLQRAPKTLRGVPAFSRSARPLVNTLQPALADVNPMLRYLNPYGRDLASYWTNFGGFVSGSDANGNIARVKPVLNANSLNLPIRAGALYNPYPRPGQHNNPTNFTGPYPKVKEDRIPR